MAIRTNILLILLFFLFTSCQHVSVRAVTTVTPEIQHLVMQGRTLKTPGGNIIRIMLLGFNDFDNHTDAYISWHMLKIRSRQITFTFNRQSGFTIKTANNSYKSIQVPENLTPALNRAGTFKIQFEKISNIRSLNNFDIIENKKETTGWTLRNCSISGGNK